MGKGIYRLLDKRVNDLILNIISYTHRYLFHFGPFSFINPLDVHLPNLCFLLIIHHIPNQIYIRFSQFALVRWNTPESPTFMLEKIIEDNTGILHLVMYLHALSVIGQLSSY